MTRKLAADRPRGRTRHNLRRELPLHLMLIPGIILYIIFCYIPMGGLVIAFQRFVPAKGMFGPQKWVGFDNFEYIFSMPNTANVIRNTVVIAVWKIVLGLIVPITVALMLNEVSNKRFKSTIQTVIYFPYFISWIVFAAIMTDILSPSDGILNMLIKTMGMQPIYFLGSNDTFQQTIIWTDVWKSFGYGTVVYLAAMTSIDPSLYEAATIDGADRFQQMVHVTLPGISMVITLMMVLSLGNVLNAGFDQIYNLYSPVVYETGDILDTMVYRLGLENAKYGPAAAVGVFKSVVSCALVSGSYYVAIKFFDYRLF